MWTPIPYVYLACEGKVVALLDRTFFLNPENYQRFEGPWAKHTYMEKRVHGMHFTQGVETEMDNSRYREGDALHWSDVGAVQCHENSPLKNITWKFLLV